MITIIVLYILLGIIALIVILLHFSVRLSVEAKTGEKPKIELKYLFFTIYPRKPKKDKTKDKDKEKADEYKSEFTDEDIEKLLADAEKMDVSQEDEKPKETYSVDKEEKPAEAIPEKPKQEEVPPKEASEDSPQDEDPLPEEEEKKEGGLAKIKRYFKMVKPYIPMAWKYFKKLLKAVRITKLDIELTSGKEDAYEAAMMYGKLNAALYNVIALLSRIFTVRVLKNTKVNCVFDEKKFEYDVSTVVLVRPSTLIAIVFCVGVNFLRIFIREKFRAWRQRRREKKENKIKQKNNETELLNNEC